MTVGEAARAVGVSPKAIRLWESRGLVPGVERSEGGYRMFTDADVVVLRFIRQAKTLGLTLNEIREVLDVRHTGGMPCNRVVQLLDEHIVRVDRSITVLHQLRRTLVDTRNHADQARPSGKKPGICCIIEDGDSVLTNFLVGTESLSKGP